MLLLISCRGSTYFSRNSSTSSLLLGLFSKSSPIFQPGDNDKLLWGMLFKVDLKIARWYKWNLLILLFFKIQKEFFTSDLGLLFYNFLQIFSKISILDCDQFCDKCCQFCMCCQPLDNTDMLKIYFSKTGNFSTWVLISCLHEWLDSVDNVNWSSAWQLLNAVIMQLFCCL